MLIEDSLPERFRRNAYHPTPFVYAWKRKELEKLFEELMASNIAISAVEVWVVQRGRVEMIVQLKSGRIEIFELKNQQKKGEEWYDFVERSCKETLDIIGGWDLERNVRPDLMGKIWYHFQFTAQS